MHPIYSRKDTFSKKAKEENYPARSVFKLEEIDKKYNIIKPNSAILDLGASPGSWTMYCAKKLQGKGTIVAVDIKDMDESIANMDNVSFYKMSVFSDNIYNLGEFNVVLSDMAPNTTGIKEVDSGKQIEMVNRVVEICKVILREGGNVVCKIFEGEDSGRVFKEFQNLFKKIFLYKPQSSRKQSREIYIIGLQKL